MNELVFPLRYKRQYANHLDADYEMTTSQRSSYLNSPLRYAGQIVIDTTEDKLYRLNFARNTWLEVGAGASGGGSGTNGQDGQGFTWRGSYSANTEYNPYDVVSSQGSTYIVVESHTTEGGVSVPNEYLELIAAKGANGSNGTIGVDGKSAYQIAVANGFVGTEAAWLLSLKGADGAQGIQGIQGIKGDQGIQGIQGPVGPSGAITADASTSVKGLVKLATSPAVATEPIAVGDNDPRLTDKRIPVDGSITDTSLSTSVQNKLKNGNTTTFKVQLTPDIDNFFETEFGGKIESVVLRASNSTSNTNYSPNTTTYLYTLETKASGGAAYTPTTDPAVFNTNMKAIGNADSVTGAWMRITLPSTITVAVWLTITITRYA